MFCGRHYDIVNHENVLFVVVTSSVMTYHQILNKSKTMSAASEAGMLSPLSEQYITKNEHV
jgi:hypothetical protein